MPKLELNTLSASEIVKYTSDRTLLCEEIARSCLARIEGREPFVKAWSHFDGHKIIQQAQAIDSSPVGAPLRGVPVGVKDIIDTYDMPTEMGSPIYRGHRPLSDASCVALLRSAGALIFGKTVTCEFAGVTAGQTTNPHDVNRTPGGSSSGSAAAVADFMVPFALGTQTGGSVQRPSSFCGIVGYKPTFGLINRQGIKAAAESLDTIGLMARTVEDIELCARTLTSAAPVQWLPVDTKIRVGVCRTHAWDYAEKCSQDAIEDTAKRLEREGHRVSDVVLPMQYSDLSATREIINDFERARGMAFEWRSYPHEISVGLAKSIRNGFTTTRETYVRAQKCVAACRRELPAVFTNVDVLLTPAVLGEAPLGLDNTGDHRFQSLWTQLRTPTITLPTHKGPHGLPVGIQLVAPLYDDDRLIAISRHLSAASGIESPAHR